MPEINNKRFTTAEEKHRKNVLLRCKICGKKVHGRSTLSRHISHAHNNIKPSIRERIIIDTYYGRDVVNRILRKIKNGEYIDKAVPIDIGRFLRLSGIKTTNFDKNKIKKPNNVSTDSTNKNKKTSDIKKINIKTDKLFVQVKDLNKEKEEEKEINYIGDLIYNKSDNSLKISITKGKTIAIDFNKIKEFIESLQIKNSVLYILNGNMLYPVNSVKVKNDDEVTGNQIKCIVGYDSTKHI